MLRRTVNTGVLPEHSFKDKQRIWLTNAGAMLSMFASIFYLISTLYHYPGILNATFNILTIGLFSLVILLNKNGLNKYSNILFLYLTLAICYMNIVLYGSNLMLHLIMIPWLILSIFLLNETISKTIAIIFGTGSFLFFERYEMYFESIFNDTSPISSRITIGLSLTAFITIALFYKANHNNYEKIIKKKNRILERQSSEISEHNHTLEEQKHEIEAQNYQLSHANNEIRSSIIYSKRIQRALLPDVSKLSVYLKEIFVYYQPKDIISGDFYWSAVIGNRIYLAAADCTGHGVPGAMMTAICHSILQNAVYEANLTTPADILRYTDGRIKQTLNNNTTKSPEVTDGMDIALCLIDKQKHVLTFSGAKRPLYKGNHKGLTIIKGNNSSIGGSLTEQSTFSEETIKYESSDSFYIFSDGIPDQFGGPRDKKFMTKQLNELLTKNRNLPLRDQKRILSDAINNWKGGHPQTDDMLFIGFKI